MKCSFIIGLKIIEAQNSFHKRERPQDIVTWIPVPPGQVRLVPVYQDLGLKKVNRKKNFFI